MYDLMLVSRVDRIAREKEIGRVVEGMRERERDRAKRADWQWCREVVGLRVAGDGIRVCTV